MLKFSRFESIIIDWRTGSQTNDGNDGREKKAVFELCEIGMPNLLGTVLTEDWTKQERPPHQTGTYLCRQSLDPHGGGIRIRAPKLEPELDIDRCYVLCR